MPVSSALQRIFAILLLYQPLWNQMLELTAIQTLAASTIVVGFFFLLRWIKQNGVEDDGKRYPPSLPLLPVFGAILRGGMSVLPEHFMRSAEKYGPVASLRFGKSLVVVLNGHEALSDALVGHPEAFADRPTLFTEKNVNNPELRGVGYSHYDEKYKKYNKLALSILKEFGFGVQGVSETRILQEVELMNEDFMKQNGRPIDPRWPLAFATSNVITSILLGESFLKSFPKAHSAIVKGASGSLENTDMTINTFPIVRYLPMFRKKIDILRKSGRNLLNAVEEGIQFIRSNPSEPTFVGRFLEIEGHNYIHQDLLYIVRDLCLASTDTVSTTLLWAIVELANHPEIQNRFQKEIDEMVPKDRLPSLDDKPRLPYTESVMLEVLRRRTLVPFFVLHATLKDTKVLEYDVPRGSLVIPNGYSAHMDAKFWKDPENFRPERFLDSDNKVINSERVIAFGLGKRSCLGELLARQTFFLFLTSLVQRYSIRPPEGQNRISVKELISVMNYPSDFEVRLISRVKSTKA